MSAYTPDHPAVWFEIPVTDLKKSVAFYEAVTTMALREEQGGPNPIAIFEAKKGDAHGVSGHLYPGKPAKGAGNTVHLAVPKPLEAALERVGPNGGNVVSDIVSLPDGRFAYCEDPDGNSVGLFTTH